MSGMAIQTASRAMAYRAAMNAMRGGVRKPRYKLPSWLTYANVAGAWKASRSARARLGTYRRQMNKALFGSRKRAQGQARLAAQGKKRKLPPNTPSARVAAKFAVADKMTKFRKTKTAKQKSPKSVSVHYKEFGVYSAEKCMYINHEHWGHFDKFWKGVAYGLTKLLLAQGKIYNAKSMEDPVIGPRTSADNPAILWDNKAADKKTQLYLIYCTEAADGQITRIRDTIDLEDTSGAQDHYLSFDEIADSVKSSLETRYNVSDKTWLAEAQLIVAPTDGNSEMAVQPVYIQNLDDAEVNLYVKSLIKFQNTTPSDGGSADRMATDANPISGRMYSAQGHYPQIDSDLANAGDKTLDSFFGNVRDIAHGGPLGITLLGHANTHTSDDLGRVSHIPHAKELYGNQTVTAGHIHMAPGAMKYHKTTFTMKRTFKSLAGIGTENVAGFASRRFGRHTLFGFHCTHRHGEDTIKVGFNRDVDVSCFIKWKRHLHPLKTNYTFDAGLVDTVVIPTNHAGDPGLNP